MNLVTLIFFRESFKHTSSANIEIFWKTVLRYIFCKLQKSHSPKLPKYYPETFYGFYFVFQLINILIFFYPNKEGIVEFVFAQLNVWVISRICAGFTCKWDLDFHGGTLHICGSFCRQDANAKLAKKYKEFSYLKPGWDCTVKINSFTFLIQCLIIFFEVALFNNITGI